VLFTWPLPPFVFDQWQNNRTRYFASWGKIDTIFLIWVAWKFSECKQESELMFQNFSESEQSRSLKNVIPLISCEHGQDWISCMILAIVSDHVGFGYLFLKKIGPGYWFDFYNEILLRVIQDVTNDGGSVFSALVFIFTKNQNDFVSMCCTDHNQWLVLLIVNFLPAKWK